MDGRDTQVPAFDYAAVFGRSNVPTEEVDRKVSGKTVPTGTYIVTAKGAKAFFSGQKGTPGVRPFVLVKEGVDGTEGVLVSDDLYLSPSPTVEEDGVTVKKTAEKFTKDADDLIRKLNRIGRILSFGQNQPANYSQTGLETYAAQFACNKDFVVEIREVTETYQGQERTKNRIVWESAAALTDPADSKKAQKAGLNAEGEAREKIAERNKREAAQAVKTGTAGTTSRQNPRELFA